MELDHFLTRSGLTYPEISSKVYCDSFCQLGSSVEVVLDYTITTQLIIRSIYIV